MRRSFIATVVGAALLGAAAPSYAQDTPAAKATRERLKKIIVEEADWKEEPTRLILGDLKRESNNKVAFHVDTTTGMSMNTRMSYKAKNISLEKILNDLADKNDFGWFIMSDKKDRYDGWVVLRKGKGKERGYEDGKEPKDEKKSAAAPPQPGRTVWSPGLIHQGSAGGLPRWQYRPIPFRRNR